MSGTRRISPAFPLSWPLFSIRFPLAAGIPPSSYLNSLLPLSYETLACTVELIQQSTPATASVLLQQGVFMEWWPMQEQTSFGETGCAHLQVGGRSRLLQNST